MTKENEEKLLSSIAAKHIGDEKFCKKYGIEFYSSKALLKCSREDSEPSTELLNEENQKFIKTFSESLKMFLNTEEQNEEFFTELLSDF